MELPVATLPPALADSVASLWGRYLKAARQAGMSPPGDSAFLAELVRVWAASDFVAEACISHPDLLTGLAESGDLARSYPEGHMARSLAVQLEGVASDEGLKVALRAFRRREMVRIAWRDLAGRADLDEVLADTSALAESCLEAALGRVDGWQREQWGVPIGARSGEPQQLVVLGMGKLGARELNFSSDIDLIFAYPEPGETDGARPRSNEEYFLRVGQRLIRALDERTADGFVFRVDMRLRPFGDSGPLAMSFDAMENYYQSQGREWERYAMIKARVVAGDRASGERLMELLQPFVYRRYLDFGVFESLREMKQLIAGEVRRKGMAGNVKLGAGGIREIEFIGQAFQLVRGGRLPALRVRPIQAVLARLAGEELLPDYAARELIDAYRFLRRVENRLQMVADRQTHLLPEKEASRLRLARATGYAEWDEFSAVLDQHRRRVAAQFEQVFAAPQGEAASAQTSPFAAIWQGSSEDAAAREQLEDAGYRDAGEALRLIGALRDSRACRALSEQGRARLDRLMPLLLGAVAASEAPDACLRRVIGLVEAVARRTVYLSLLIEHPVVLSQLVRLAAASPWIATLLTRHPILLDGLLDPRTLYQPPGRAELEAELVQRLAAVAEDDLEQQMEALRQFRQAQVLRVAAVDVAGAVPLMVVSDHLTEIAEVVLGGVLGLAWRQLAARHGEPGCEVEGERRRAGFAVIAYGKLGGIELGYGSDLDVVFLHDSGGERQTTDGERSVDNSVFFARLGQRIIHLLTTVTPSGVLYEVDTRLRPSGASGLLVSSFEAFADYQRREAWTWEHQALVRARPVAGSEEIGRRFEALRAEVLSRPRDPEALRGEVREMRERMRGQLGSGASGGFDLKHDEGGIADIEFIVQYLVLREAAEHPAVYAWSDNIRQLEALVEADLLDAADGRHLTESYRTLRARVHRLKLQEQPARVPDDEYRPEREGVRRIWRAVMGG